MEPSYVVWNSKNLRIETFAGPCRLAAWIDFPKEWSIERFLGDVSQGAATMDDVRLHANAYYPLTRYAPCPACKQLYDTTRIPPPRVPLNIRCACCCQ